MYVCMYVFMQQHTHMSSILNARVHLCTNAQMYVCMYARMCLCIHTYMHIYIYTYTVIHTHKFIYTDMRFMLLHDGKSEENVRGFFAEVHELYIKVFLISYILTWAILYSDFSALHRIVIIHTWVNVFLLYAICSFGQSIHTLSIV
jgi:hypothetical protein